MAQVHHSESLGYHSLSITYNSDEVTPPTSECLPVKAALLTISNLEDKINHFSKVESDAGSLTGYGLMLMLSNLTHEELCLPVDTVSRDGETMTFEGAEAKLGFLTLY